MRYPQRSPYLKYKRINKDEYLVEDWVREKAYTISVPAVKLLKQMNGRKNPYECNTVFNMQEIKDLISDFEEYSLLAEKKKPLHYGFASYRYPLIYVYPTGIAHILGKIFNFLLLLASIPLPITGLHILNIGLPYIPTAERWQCVAGICIGVGSGMILHELAHISAGLSYKARVAEFGLAIISLSLIGYVLMDTSDLKNKYQKAQIYAAGIEMNLLLFGVFMCAASAGGRTANIAYSAGIINLITAILNALPLKGLDGMNILKLFCKK